jgi:uncharacterized damage-inducible protein DinB
MSNRPEVWLRGPVDGVPAHLQPVAHALLQAREEVTEALATFPDERLWDRPAGVASVGFHLRHLAGVIDRLFTYARAEPLSDAQRAALAGETEPGDVGVRELVAAFGAQVDHALDQLRHTDPEVLTAPREVGRQRLPSTVLGLLFHAAEHTQRHVGQLLVTARVAADMPDGTLPR